MRPRPRSKWASANRVCGSSASAARHRRRTSPRSADRVKVSGGIAGPAWANRRKRLDWLTAPVEQGPGLGLVVAASALDGQDGKQGQASRIGLGIDAETIAEGGLGLSRKECLHQHPSLRQACLHRIGRRGGYPSKQPRRDGRLSAPERRLDLEVQDIPVVRLVPAQAIQEVTGPVPIPPPAAAWARAQRSADRQTDHAIHPAASSIPRTAAAIIGGCHRLVAFGSEIAGTGPSSSCPRSHGPARPSSESRWARSG